MDSRVVIYASNRGRLSDTVPVLRDEHNEATALAVLDLRVLAS